MVMHKAIKPFGWYPNGYEREALEIGDERDFGDVADGLVVAKMIAPVDADDVKRKSDKAHEEMHEAHRDHAGMAKAEAALTAPEPTEDGAPVESESDEVADDQPKRRGRSRK